MKNRAGFSIVEVLTAVSIVLVLSVIVIPNIVVTIGNVRLRASMTSLSGVMQNARTLAVKQNLTKTTRFSLESSGIIAYVKNAGDNSAVTINDPQVQLQAPISRMTDLTGPDAPDALDAVILGFTPNGGHTSFNSRGLPCLYSAGTCNSRGFRYYFKDSRASGDSGWSAISISPAGRINKWYWSGDEWVN